MLLICLGQRKPKFKELFEFIVIALAYGVVWLMMRRRVAEMADFDSGDSRRRNADRLMFILVTEPSDRFLVVCVFFVNLGGVY